MTVRPPRRTRRRVDRTVRREAAVPCHPAAAREKAAELLACHGGDPAAATVIMGANCVVAVDPELVVRLAFTWPFDPQREAAAWTAARCAGIPAPEHVASGQADGQPYVVYRRLPGEPLKTSAGVIAAAQTLAAIHHLDLTLAPPDRRMIRPRRRARFALALDAIALLPPAERSVARWLVTAARLDFERSCGTVVHGDFRGPNVLEFDGRISGVVDWSDHRQGSPESDLGGTDLILLEPLVRAYEDVTSRLLDRDLLAGHALARTLALTACAVPGADSELRRARQFVNDGRRCG